MSAEAIHNGNVERTSVVLIDLSPQEQDLLVDPETGNIRECPVFEHYPILVCRVFANGQFGKPLVRTCRNQAEFHHLQTQIAAYAACPLEWSWGDPFAEAKAEDEVILTHL